MFNYINMNWVKINKCDKVLKNNYLKKYIKFKPNGYCYQTVTNSIIYFQIQSNRNNAKYFPLINTFIFWISYNMSLSNFFINFSNRFTMKNIILYLLDRTFYKYDLNKNSWILNKKILISKNQFDMRNKHENQQTNKKRRPIVTKPTHFKTRPFSGRSIPFSGFASKCIQSASFLFSHLNSHVRAIQ